MQAIITTTTASLRVSVLRKITLRVLRVSPKAIAGAFKSFHSLLLLNTDTRNVIFTEARRKVLAIITIIPETPNCVCIPRSVADCDY